MGNFFLDIENCILNGTIVNYNGEIQPCFTCNIGGKNIILTPKDQYNSQINKYYTFNSRDVIEGFQNNSQHNYILIISSIIIIIIMVIFLFMN